MDFKTLAIMIVGKIYKMSLDNDNKDKGQLQKLKYLLRMVLFSFKTTKATNLVEVIN